jgi:hypothetical protein
VHHYINYITIISIIFLIIAIIANHNFASWVGIHCKKQAGRIIHHGGSLLVPMQQRRMAGAAAMSMRSTCGCGSLGAESHAWVVLRLQRLQKGRSLKPKAVDRKKRAAETRQRRKALQDGLKMKCV